MHKLILLILFFTFTLGYGQNYEDNTFRKSEETSDKNGGTESALLGGPGDPANDPVPIDDYIPVLFVVGMGIVVYTYVSGKKQLENIDV
jgi:hypothetical protein